MKNLKDYIAFVNEQIENAVLKKDLQPVELYDPVKYILSNGGKRIRAVMTLISARLFADDISNAISPALGLEVFHNFTLLHDDIMDKASIRRGIPTVHLKWDENTAILSGDAMMIMANKLVFNVPHQILPEIIQTFNQTALEVCEGQQYDMNLETKQLAHTEITEEEYLEMIRLKTSVLIGCSLKIGAICGGATREQSEAIYNYGVNIGLAFQIQDDLLDSFGLEAEFGKRIGGDIIEGKKTYLLIKALQNASSQDKNRLIAIINDRSLDETSKIVEIKAIYERSGAKKLAEEKIEDYFKKAGYYLSSMGLSESRMDVLKELEKSLQKRNK